jgi:hypothetical protein
MLYTLMMKNRRPINSMVNMPKYRMDTPVLAAGTSKNKRLKNIKKTRNNKIRTKKCSIKKIKNKIKRHTRRT